MPTEQSTDCGPLPLQHGAVVAVDAERQRHAARRPVSHQHRHVDRIDARVQQHRVERPGRTWSIPKLLFQLLETSLELQKVVGCEVDHVEVIL